ncbi:MULTISPECIES: efflux transporter outer membrane subunit [unclassified Rudaea]|uniref:efflux transporter outer membrane subunit n=1 Tax=unclassified Rudaea TaxID=2627037 RepID=UPI0020163B97|nr:MULTISPECIES: efflux transporter outer membrane subunit [unclassified Rudaea]
MLCTSALAVVLSGCAVGPDYKKPDVPGTDAYKDDAWKEQAGWKPAQPGDTVERGAWWEVFADAELNDLMKQVDVSNQSLKQAEAQYRQASALVSGARASFLPTVTANLSATRTGRYSTSGGGTVTGGTVAAGKGYTNSYQLPISATWEPDLWGSVRRTVEGDVASAQASAATLANTRLSLQATLAQTYFQLRIADEQKRLLDDTVAAYQKALDLTQNQYNVGVAARSDVVQAQTQLKSAQAQAIDLGVARAQYEHAIAVLVGKAPAQFSLAAKSLKADPPKIPLELPSVLLERRPDVAVAERQAAQASAQIGVATAAWFPSLTLSATGGYSNSSWSKLLEAPSRYWSIGPKIAETLFDGGARRAQTAQARAGYDAAVANYRQVSLAAFQNVEDQIAALRILEQEAQAQDEAVKLAEQALAIAINQYRAGIVSYLNVITAQNTAYSNERTAITLLGTRYNDSIALIKALGGGWQAKELPEAKAIGVDSPLPQAR